MLLVRSRYPNRPEPLWNLPGGRQRQDELLRETLAREFLEETGLAIVCGALGYVSESYDRATGTHFLNLTFEVRAEGEPRAASDDAHVVGLAWVARADLAAYLPVEVVRKPLLAYLGGEPRRYFAFDDAGITIEFADSS